MSDTTTPSDAGQGAAGAPTTPAPQGTPASPDGSLYSKLQSERDAALAKAEKLEKKLNSFENVEELETRAKEAELRKFNAEAEVARVELIKKEFPHLVGKEHHIKLGTLDEMKAHAYQLSQDFGLKPAQANQPPAPTKGDAGQQGNSTSEIVSALGNLSEEQLRETLKRLPTEELAKIINVETPDKSWWNSPYSRSLTGKK